jgi:hypothetical protein
MECCLPDNASPVERGPASGPLWAWARSIGEAVVYSGAAVAEIAAGNLAYTAHQYGLSWCASKAPNAL